MEADGAFDKISLKRNLHKKGKQTRRSANQ
jgi:hypothetical protein